MAALFVDEEQGLVGQAYSCQHVRFISFGMMTSLLIKRCSIRFAPPLVISEEDVRKAVKIIGESLEELDTVSHFMFL